MQTKKIFTSEIAARARSFFAAALHKRRVSRAAATPPRQGMRVAAALVVQPSVVTSASPVTASPLLKI